ITQVRQALQRQNEVLEDAHLRLEQLTGRLTQVEERNRIREVKLARAREEERREQQRQDDERWINEWNRFCISTSNHLQKTVETTVATAAAAAAAADAAKAAETVAVAAAAAVITTQLERPAENDGVSVYKE
ncbi:hypothetical protein BX616_006771, partial [Lobosporangium transversale]